MAGVKDGVQEGKTGGWRHTSVETSVEVSRDTCLHACNSYRHTHAAHRDTHVTRADTLTLTYIHTYTDTRKGICNILAHAHMNMRIHTQTHTDTHTQTHTHKHTHTHTHTHTHRQTDRHTHTNAVESAYIQICSGERKFVGMSSHSRTHVPFCAPFLRTRSQTGLNISNVSLRKR